MAKRKTDKVDSRLTPILKELSNLTWTEFVSRETSKDYSTAESLVYALVRACYMQKLDAIKISLNRLDGKVATPIVVEYPKVFYLYPNVDPKTIKKTVKTALPEPEVVKTKELVNPQELSYEEAQKQLLEASLRETVGLMADHDRKAPKVVLEYAAQAENHIRRNGPMPENDPKVKSVIAASLLAMGQRRDIDALYEIFDQIEGRVAETFRIIGDDIHLIQYTSTAPEGAYINDDGVVEVEAKNSQETWRAKLESNQK